MLPTGMPATSDSLTSTSLRVAPTADIGETLGRHPQSGRSARADYFSGRQHCTVKVPDQGVVRFPSALLVAAAVVVAVDVSEAARVSAAAAELLPLLSSSLLEEPMRGGVYRSSS